MRFNHPREWFGPAPIREEGPYTPRIREGWLIVVLILLGLWVFAWTMLQRGRT